MRFLRFNLYAIVTFVVIYLAGCSTTPVPSPTTPAESVPSATTIPGQVPGNLQVTSFSSLPGWNKDEVSQAWPAFLNSCSVLAKKVEWAQACTAALQVNGQDTVAVRTFFETYFTPYKLTNSDGSDNGLVTGYYEPLLRGARKRGGMYQTPLYGPPADMLTIDLGSAYPDLKGLRLRGRLEGKKVVPYRSRAELLQSRVLAGKELLWVDDPIDAFFMQVQGSGRVYLTDTGETVRLAYADQNGYAYTSIGRYLVDHGELTLAQASAQGIKSWIAAHPSRKDELLNVNKSYVFFREEHLTDPSQGPKGALGVPLTEQRSIAVDPKFVPLGAPVFLSTTQPNNSALLQRLVLAQDTGGAIRGAVRADYFWGFGDEAGNKAGAMKQRGGMWVLLPNSVSSRQ